MTKSNSQQSRLFHELLQIKSNQINEQIKRRKSNAFRRHEYPTFHFPKFPNDEKLLYDTAAKQVTDHKAGAYADMPHPYILPNCRNQT